MDMSSFRTAEGIPATGRFRGSGRVSGRGLGVLGGSDRAAELEGTQRGRPLLAIVTMLLQRD